MPYYDKDIYLFFNISSGMMNSELYYLNTNNNPKEYNQSSLTNSQIYYRSDINEYPKYYNFKFPKCTLTYLLFKYSGFNGNNLTISCSTSDIIKNIPIYLAKDKILRVNSSKSHYMYVNYSDFSLDDNIYVSISYLYGLISLYYENTNDNPRILTKFTSFKSKDYDKIGKNNEYEITSYKFNREIKNKYLIIYYGKYIEFVNILVSNKDPLASTTDNFVIIIICTVIGAVIIISGIIFLLICKKKNIENIEEITESKNTSFTPSDEVQNFSPIDNLELRMEYQNNQYTPLDEVQDVTPIK